MTYQYISEKVLNLGSADIRIAMYSDETATYETAKSIGLLDGIKVTRSGDKVTLKSDNSSDIDLGLSNVELTIEASAWKDIDLHTLYDLLGHVGEYNIVSASAQTVTAEPVGLVSTIASALKHKTDAVTPTEVTNITVKNGSRTYTLGTDYTVGLTSSGYTTITRVASGAIPSGTTVSVGYKYTPKASESLSFGSTIKPEPLHVWIVNKDENGNKFGIEVYKVDAMSSEAFTFGIDTDKTPITTPISMVGRPDAKRAAVNAYDDLYHIINEKVNA